MAFDPDAYLASKSEPSRAHASSFDPDSYLQTKAQESNEKTMPIESAGRGFVQGASMGFADEISGGAEALWEKAKGDPTEFGNLYKKHRDESRANFKKAESDNPGYYTAGEVGGNIATAAVPFGSTATLAKAAVTGARLGAASALGGSEADNAGDMIKDTATGAALGAAGGAAAKKLEGIFPLLKGGVKSAKEAGVKEAAETAEHVLSKEAGSIPVEDANVLKEAAKSAQSRLKSFLNPDIDPSFEEYAEIAKKHGIDPSNLPESVKFGPDSSASRASRNLAEGRFGEETLKRFNQTLDKVRDAYDKKIVKYSSGIPTDEITAGKILRDSYDEGVQKFFNDMDITYNSVMDMAPGMQMSEESLKQIDSALGGVEKFAKGRMARGVTQTQRGQGQQLMNAVEAIRSGNGSYKQTVEALRDIGEAAYQSKGSLADVPVDVAKMRKLYSDVNEAVLGSVRSNLGDDIADSLVANNKAMSEFFGEKSLVSRVMGDKAISPESAFKTLIINGDSQKLEALKKILPAEKWEYLKGAVLENLVKRDPESNFTFRQLHNSMRNKRSALSSIFTPEELAENAGLVRLGDRFGNPVLSSSGTGASLSFGDLTKSATNLSVDALAIKNANRAANKSLNKATELAESPMRDVSPALKSLPARTASAMAAVPAANKEANSESPIKGPEMWAKRGADNLKSAGIESTLIDELKGSKAGRDLLIEASDAGHGSKRLEGILKKIRTSYMNGGE